MIIEPDFLDHWKTRALVDLSKKPESPLWLIRLWAHCHSRKAWQFNLPPIALKSICGVSADISADDWFKWLKECRFIEGTKSDWQVHDWEKHNSGLVSRWGNGRQPKRAAAQADDKRTTSEPQADSKPTEAPLPSSPPDRYDRDDRSDRDEKSDGDEGKAPTSRKGKPASFGEVEAFIADSGIVISPISAAKFFNHFEANGWRTRAGRVRDWRAALRNWVLNEDTYSGAKNSVAGAAPAAGQFVSDPVIFK